MTSDLDVTGDPGRIRRLGWWCAAALTILCLGGCGKPLGTLEGTVAFQGEPVSGGFVMLFPTDGKYRNASSVEIVEGRYRITGIVPGERKIGLDDLQLKAGADGQPRRLPDVTGSFPETITVVAGPQKLDFSLEAKGKKPRK